MKKMFYIILLFFLICSFKSGFCGLFGGGVKIEKVDFPVSLSCDTEKKMISFDRDLKDEKGNIKYKFSVIPIRRAEFIVGWESQVFRVTKGVTENENLLINSKTRIESLSPHNFLGWDLSSAKGSAYPRVREFKFDKVALNIEIVSFQILSEPFLESLDLKVYVAPK